MYCLFTPVIFTIATISLSTHKLLIEEYDLAQLAFKYTVSNWGEDVDLIPIKIKINMNTSSIIKDAIKTLFLYN